MKIPKMILLLALVSLKLSAGESDVSSQIQLSGDELGLVQSQLQQDWSEAEKRLIFATTPTCQSFFSYCASVHGPALFEWIEGKSIAILTQAVSLSLHKDYLFTFMRNMKQNLFSLYETPSLEESKRALRSYLYASFPQKWLRTLFHAGFNFVQHEPMLRAFFENNRQGTRETQMRESLLDHLLTTRSGAQSLILFFENLDLLQKASFLKRSLFNAKRLRGFKDNTCILSDFPELQAHVIQHNAWLDLTSKMDNMHNRHQEFYLRDLSEEKAHKLFACCMFLQAPTQGWFGCFAFILTELEKFNSDQGREIFFSIMQDSTGDPHYQAYARKLYMRNNGNCELVKEICESILQDPKSDLTRQLYAVQALVEMDPVVQALCRLQELSTEIWKYRGETTPIQIRARIHACAKKVFASFQKTDLEALSRDLKQNPDEDYADRIESMLLELESFSEKERAETKQRFDLRMRITLQNPKPLEYVIQPREKVLESWGDHRDTWKIRLAKESFPFDPLGAEALLLDIVHQDRIEEADEAALLLRMFNRPGSARKAYARIASNPEESPYLIRHAQDWLEADEAVALLTDSSCISPILSLEFSYLLDRFQGPRTRENLWDKIFLHTQSKLQRETAKNKVKHFRDNDWDVRFPGEEE